MFSNKSSYKLVTGTLNEVSEFEKNISEAIESGYNLAGDIKMQEISGGEIILMQSLIKK